MIEHYNIKFTQNKGEMETLRKWLFKTENHFQHKKK